MHPFARQIIWNILPWGISLAAMVYALWGVNFALLWQSISAYPLWSMVMLLLPLCFDYSLMGVRLQWLLPGRTPYIVAVKGIILCLGYNNILPAKAGDVLKIAYVSKRLSLPVAVITPYILWERCMDVIMLTMLCLFAMLLVEVPVALAFGGVLLLGLGIVFYGARRYSPLFHTFYDKVFPVRIASIIHTLHHHAVDAVTLQKIGQSLLASIIIWGVHCGTFMLGFMYVANFDLSFSQMLVVFVVTCLGMVLPSSPANLGLFEGAMVLALSWYGIGHSEALGFALFMHMLYFLPVSIAALLFGSSFGSFI